jgi:predicted nucleic acid-binding protein
MSSILLDTNVLVYAFDVRQSSLQEKAQAIILKAEETATGCLSVQCLGEFFRVVTAKMQLPANEMFKQVEYWQSAFPVFSLTPQIVLEAARGVRDYQLSYYDAQIWASARLNQIPVIFSEDFQDGQTLEGVRFINPFANKFMLEEW